MIGAPGPENSQSLLEFNGSIFGWLLDPLVALTVSPNQARDLMPITNGDYGTLSLRRSFTNNTGAPLKKIRFRVIDITNSPSSTDADVRLLSSITSIINGQIVEGVTLEQPPLQSAGGGVNATAKVGTISVAQPLAVGATVNAEFKLGVVRKGKYRFFLNIEAAQ